MIKDTKIRKVVALGHSGVYYYNPPPSHTQGGGRSGLGNLTEESHPKGNWSEKNGRKKEKGG